MPGVRLFAAPLRPVRPAGAPRVVPDAWLIPGLGALVVSLLIYAMELHRYWSILWGGLDLRVYQGGGEAMRHGRHVYELGWTNLHLPYTYPPITLFPNAALSLLGWRDGLAVMTMLSTGCLAVTAWLVFGMAGVARSRGRVGLSAFAAAGAVWLEPMLANINLGQINALLMLLVVADLALPDRSRFKGLAIGLAAGMKLVPGLFIVYLVLTGRLRAAAVSAGVFALTVLIGFVALPEDSAKYWGGAFLDSRRVASVAEVDYFGNQSLHGLAARALPGDGDWLWLLLAIPMLLAGLALAVLIQRRGQELLGMLVVAFTGVLVSPIAWTHHWVWVLPLLIFVWLGASGLTGRWQLLAQTGALALTVVFIAWPYSQPEVAPLVPLGAVWRKDDWIAHGLPGFLLHDLYTITMLAAFVVLAGWLWRTRSTGAPTGHRETATDGTGPPTESQPTSAALTSA